MGVIIKKNFKKKNYNDSFGKINLINHETMKEMGGDIVCDDRIPKREGILPIKKEVIKKKVNDFKSRERLTNASTGQR